LKCTGSARATANNARNRNTAAGKRIADKEAPKLDEGRAAAAVTR
jgi:hypothetical protein